MCQAWHVHVYAFMMSSVFHPDWVPLCENTFYTRLKLQLTGVIFDTTGHLSQLER